MNPPERNRAEIEMTFLEMTVEHQPGRVEEALAFFERSSEEITTGIKTYFDTSHTLQRRDRYEDRLYAAVTAHGNNLGDIYEMLQKEGTSTDEMIGVISHLIHGDLTARHAVCIASEIETLPITYSLEGITQDITSAFSEGEDFEDDTETAEEAIKEALVEDFQELIGREVSRVLDYAPSDEEYRQFSVRESLPGIALDIGKIAVGTAIGTAVALFMTRKKS